MRALLSSLFGGVWGYVAAAAVAAVAAGWLVHRVDDAAYKALQLADERAKYAAVSDAISLTKSLDALSNVIGLRGVQAQQNIVTRTIGLIQEVPIYVTPETDALFPLPCGFIRLHDAVVAGVEPSALPNPAGKSDGDACEVKASTAASVIAENYGAALGWRQSLVDWQDWYAQVRAKWDAEAAVH